MKKISPRGGEITDPQHKINGGGGANAQQTNHKTPFARAPWGVWMVAIRAKNQMFLKKKKVNSARCHKKKTPFRQKKQKRGGDWLKTLRGTLFKEKN